MENIILVGGGGHCRSVIDVIEKEEKYKIAGIIDKSDLIGEKILGYEIIGNDDDLPKLRQKYSKALITVGHLKSNNIRLKIFELLNSLEFILPTIISPLAYVSKHSIVDIGTIVMHGAMINANTKIGKNCIINSKALIEHDCVVEDHCHISTSAVINGGVIVQENTFVGSNATSKEYINIEGFVKAGSLVK